MRPLRLPRAPSSRSKPCACPRRRYNHRHLCTQAAPAFSLGSACTGPRAPRPTNTKSFTAASLPQTPKIARRSSAWRRIANERKLHPKRDPSAPSSTRCWAELLRRTFSHDLLRWQRCSSAAVGEQRGRARVIAAITQPRQTLRQSSLCTRATPSSFPCSTFSLYLTPRRRELCLTRGPPAPASQKLAPASNELA